MTECFESLKTSGRCLAVCLLLAVVVAPAWADDGGSPMGVTGHLRDVGVSGDTIASVSEVVYFKTAPPPPSPFRRRIAEKKGLTTAPTTIMGRLYLPDGQPPFPAVVLLHGSAGIWVWNEVWARRLRGWGYAVLEVDSLTPRGLYPYNNLGLYSGAGEKKGRWITATERSGDAHGARAYLSSLSLVDAKRIAVLGMSQGGSTVMTALDTPDNTEVPGAFQAGVALYPRCTVHNAFAAPLLVLIGSADEFVSAEVCEKTLAALSRGSRPLLKIYPGAHHVFDFDGPDLVQWGRLIRYDPQAAADAVARIKAFLATHLR